MGTLRDEAYEKLDYLSQLTEVVISPQNEVLARIPDRIELSFDEINLLKNTAWGPISGYQLYVSSVLSNHLSGLDSSYINDIKQYFKFEASNDFAIDIANKKIVGSLVLIKTVQQVDEKKLLEIAIQKAGLLLSHYDWPPKRLREKVVTILNTLEPGHGTEWVKIPQRRGTWECADEIKRLLSHVILENKWRIRDAAVIIKVGSWINSYLVDNEDKSLGLVNLLKLKIMLDKDLPVYSVDEVENANSI